MIEQCKRCEKLKVTGKQCGHCGWPLRDSRIPFSEPKCHHGNPEALCGECYEEHCDEINETFGG